MQDYKCFLILFLSEGKFIFRNVGKKDYCEAKANDEKTENGVKFFKW